MQDKHFNQVGRQTRSVKFKLLLIRGNKLLYVGQLKKAWHRVGFSFSIPFQEVFAFTRIAGSFFALRGFRDLRLPFLKIKQSLQFGQAFNSKEQCYEKSR